MKIHKSGFACFQGISLSATESSVLERESNPGPNLLGTRKLTCSGQPNTHRIQFERHSVVKELRSDVQRGNSVRRPIRGDAADERHHITAGVI